MRRTEKLLLLACLYVAQYVPTTFFIQTVPVLMRQQNRSLGAIGLLGFLVLPSALKFLWSPLVDRYRLPRLGHYRGWIILCQSLLIATLAVAAGLNPQTQLMGLLVCMFLAFLFSASQDIATDALAVNLLAASERGMGNAVQASGNFLGAIIGGGVALVVLDRAGFRLTLLLLAIVLILCLLPVLGHREPSAPTSSPESWHQASLPSASPPKPLTYRQSFLGFFSRPGMGLWLLVVLLYMISENVSGTLIRPLLVDRGLSLSEIGWLLGVVSYLARIAGALSAGVLIGKLGRARSLIGFGLLANLAALTYILPAIGVSGLPVLYSLCILVSGLQSMAYTALLTAIMDRSHPATAGTDYTTQISAAFVGVVATTVLGGLIADAIGYVATLTLGVAMSILSLLLIPQLQQTRQQGTSA